MPTLEVDAPPALHKGLAAEMDRTAVVDGSAATVPWVQQTTTTGGIPLRFRVCTPLTGAATTNPHVLQLHLEHASLKLLRGFDQLLCLEGIHGVEHLPHQIETVRKVLRHFRGRVLLADEVGLGKTIG